MINTSKLTPKIYSKDSRDYQLMCHLFDAAFNNSKATIDAYDPATRTNVDNKFIDLACRTFGFFNKRGYEASTMLEVLFSFKYLLQHKGEMKAIKEATRLILRSQGVDKDSTIIADNDNCTIQISLPIGITDIALLEEIMDYILPAGYLYEFTFGEVKEGDDYSYRVITKPLNEYGKSEKTDIGISEMKYQGKDTDPAAPEVNIGVVVGNDAGE